MFPTFFNLKGRVRRKKQVSHLLVLFPEVGTGCSHSPVRSVLSCQLRLSWVESGALHIAVPFDSHGQPPLGTPAADTHPQRVFAYFLWDVSSVWLAEDLTRPFLVLPCRWFFPIIGHMGICTSTGVIRDFAGPYFVSEDNMAFGKPAKYWKLDPAQVYASGPNAWDTAVHDASEEYKHRMHNLCCDNCHSHVALALNLMRYNNSTSWNMVTLCFFCLLYGKYVSVGAFVKTWLPFLLLLGIVLTFSLALNLR
uniref:Transmembrane protein 222 n=1 Tax=Oryctolagus cuniculus TaxID=9986 RepID=A0A5F9D932_RABIT